VAYFWGHPVRVFLQRKHAETMRQRYICRIKSLLLMTASAKFSFYTLSNLLFSSCTWRGTCPTVHCIRPHANTQRSLLGLFSDHTQTYYFYARCLII